MYPNLTGPLLVLVGAGLGAIAFLLLRRPVLRRLALRQVARRRTEALLVVGGSVLGTAIIVGALVVGDTLGFSVRQTAYRTLGPIDERVVSTSSGIGALAANRLVVDLAGDPDVDGVLTAQVDQAAATRGSGATAVAEPRVLAWETDYTAARHFGAAGGPSGLAISAPPSGHVVINAALALSLSTKAGDPITLFLFGRPHQFYVDAVIPTEGLAGTGFGSSVNRNVFLPEGTFARLSTTADADPRVVTFVSNTGGVQRGNRLTATVTAKIRQAIGTFGPQLDVQTPKKDVLLNAQRTGDSLGALFLMIGSFSIIAGALLLVNIFVMLAEDRKGMLGMLRATGLRRSSLIGAFAIEGALYAVAASIVGVGLGIGVGWGVSFIAARIFNSWSFDGNGLDVTFSVTPTSLVNGAALGLVIALATIVVTSIRVSRINIIAAIRDLQVTPSTEKSRRRVRWATSAAALLGVLAVPAVATSQPEATYVLPALTALCLTPLLAERLGRRRGHTLVAGSVVVWSLVANLVRPAIFDTPSMAVYVIQGTQLAFAAVALVTVNQSVVLRPFRRLIERSTPGGLAARIGVANPLVKRFRTGATLIMYTLIVLVLVLLTEIGGIIHNSVDTQVGYATAGYDVRVDFNPDAATSAPAQLLTAGPAGRDVLASTPLVSALARSTDPGKRTTEPIDTLVEGVTTSAVQGMGFSKRLAGLTTDAAVWEALSHHPDYVVLDQFFAAQGGPNGQFYLPGDSFSVTNPATGVAERKTIAGILRSAVAFYSPMRPASFPLITSAEAVRQQFGDAVTVSSALVKVRAGTAAEAASALQVQHLAASLVATDVASTVRHMFDANVAFFQLMQGFLALGLVVGITGLGVVMVRAVRERRRSIGILRALGFRAGTVERSFLIESGFIATEGVLLGTGLGVLTTYVMYRNGAMFEGVRNGYPIPWLTLAGMAVLVVAASLAMTIGPARRAAKILPAIATRVAD
ncbi:ABC transporter permease [Humibacter sp.]|uniref:ABC transporter permease n=1 Tax=Humibacter sp. TaxID=1940291 RepID=UPI002C996A1D|nr:FtsX-like permease family protein [Humibacter sp.]HVX08794.1 FtsX-like permease family protein [Humibacter sp.]